MELFVEKAALVAALGLSDRGKVARRLDATGRQGTFLHLGDALRTLDAGGSAENAPPVEDIPDVLMVDIREAARRLSLSVTTVRAAIAAGELEAVRAGRAVRLPVPGLAAYMTMLREKASHRA